MKKFTGVLFAVLVFVLVLGRVSMQVQAQNTEAPAGRFPRLASV